MNILHIDHDTDYLLAFKNLLLVKAIDYQKEVEHFFQATDFCESKKIILENEIDYIITECFLFYDKDGADDGFENFERLLKFIENFKTKRISIFVVTMHSHKINSRYSGVLNKNNILLVDKLFSKNKIFDLIFK